MSFTIRTLNGSDTTYNLTGEIITPNQKLPIVLELTTLRGELGEEIALSFSCKNEDEETIRTVFTDYEKDYNATVVVHPNLEESGEKRAEIICRLKDEQRTFRGRLVFILELIENLEAALLAIKPK